MRTMEAEIKRRNADETGRDLCALTRSQPVKEATGEIHVLGYVGIEAMNFAKLFCPGRLTADARTFRLTLGSALDLRIGLDLITMAEQAEC